MREVYVQGGPIPLGRQGENQAQAVIWQGIAAQYADLYGEGAFQLMVARCGDAAPYPVVLTRDGDSLVWTVSDSDTAKSGVGRCELTYLVGGAVAKSKTWQTQVLASFTADGSAEPPEPAQSWVQEVLDAAAAAGKSAEAAADSADKAEDASVHAPQIGADGAWETWDQATGAYVPTGVEAQGPKGDDGTAKFIVTCDLAENDDGDIAVSNPSHTVDEIIEAYNAGMDVVLQANAGDFTLICPLLEQFGTSFLWGVIAEGIVSVVVFANKENGTDEWSTDQIELATSSDLAEARKKFIVNVTGPVAGTNGESSTITADHTFAEVVAAHEAGMSVEIHGSFTGFTGIQAICAPVAYVSQQLILCGSSLNFAPLSEEGLYQFTITGTVANEWTLIVNRIDQNAGEHMIIAGAAGSDGEFVPAKTYTATELKQAYDSGTIIDIMVNFSGSSNDGGVLLHLISYNNNSFGWGLVFPFNDSYEDETGTLVNTYTDIIYSVSAEMDLTNNTISWGKKAVLETVSFSDKIKPLQTQVNTNTSDISTLKSRVTTLGNNVKQSNWATNDTSDYSYVQNRPGAYDQYNDTEITESNNTFTCPSSFIAEDQDILIKFNELGGEGGEGGYTYGEMPVLLDRFSEISTDDMGNEITPFYGIRDSFAVSAYQADTEDYIGAFRYQITITITSKDDGNGQATGTIEIFEISDGGGLSGGPSPSISHIYHRETIHVKIPSKYLESPDIIIKLALNDSTITQTTSYTANELINAFDAGMNIRAAIFISDIDANFLIPCISKQTADSGVQLIWVWDSLMITMVVDSSGEVTWGMITDDSNDVRFDDIESRLGQLESRLPVPTTADAGKFLRLDASFNAVWEAIPNANGVNF